METSVNDIESLELYKHADSKVAIIVADGTPGFNGVLHVFMTNDSLASWLNPHREEYPDVEFRYVVDYLGIAVNFAIWEDVEGMSLHSDKGTCLDVSREDLTVYVDLFDSFRALVGVKNGKLSLGEASNKLKSREVFFIGDIPTTGQMEKRNVVYGKTTMSRYSGKEKYDVIAAYLTEHSARALADNAPVNKCKLSVLASFWNYQMPVVLEPDRMFGVEFPGEALI